MKKHITTLALLLLGFAAIAQQQEANTLHVIGRSEIEVAPDLFEFNIGFTYTTGSMETSIEQLNDAMDKVISAITSQTEIKSDSIKTKDFGTHVNDGRYDKTKNTTYSAFQSLVLTISHEQEEIIKILNLITRTNSKINIRTRSFISDKSRAAIEEDLINMAFDHARYQGKLLGKAGDFKLGKVRSVNYTQGNPFNEGTRVQLRGISQMDASKEMAFGDFNVEKQKISKQIDVTFYIYQ